MPQNLFLRHTEKSRQMHNLQRLHLTISLEHAGYGRWGKPEMACEIGLGCTDARQRLAKPGTVHNVSFAIAVIDMLTMNE
jgi:hypothetical protein